MGGRVDMEIAQYGSVIKCTFLPTIHTIFPLDLTCDAIQWVYVYEMRRWSEQYLLIFVDLDYGCYCNGYYWGPVI